MSPRLPPWFHPLVDHADGIGGADLSRFLPPEDGSGRQSAVLIALADTERGPAVLLTERSADLRSHRGQVAFPGGSLEPGDASPRAAALREAAEEVGLDAAGVQCVLDLPAIFIPVSGFVVTPVLAWWREPHAIGAVDPAEVARAMLVPLSELAEPANRFRVVHPSGYAGPGFEAGGLFVWGFTAGLLDRLLALGGWTRPWDERVQRPLPPQLSGR